MRRAFGPVRRAGAVAVIAAALVFDPVWDSPLHGKTPAGGRAVITEASIRGHMEMLASDALAGRGSGTRDEWIAATYIGSELRRWGFEPLGDAGGFVQTIETPRNDFAKPPTLTAGADHFTHGKEMLVEGVGAPHVSGPLARFVRGATIPAGSVVLVVGPDAPDASAVSNAAAVVTLETAPVRARWDRVAADTRVPPSDGRTWRITLDAGSFLAMSHLADGVAVTLDAEITPGHTWNAVGRLTGAGAGTHDVVLLTAHLDHLGTHGTGPDTIYNGADDDASGSTTVLELAEAIAAGPRPARTVIVAWFGSEEVGGFGARYFLDHPPTPLTDIIANIEFEMVGRPDAKVPPKTLWLTGYERTNLGPALAKHGARIVADPHPEQNFFERSDNIQLAYRGVVAQTASSFGLHPEYHTPADDLSHIDFPYMTTVIQSFVEPVLWLANSTFKPEWLPGMRPQPGR